MEVLKQPGGGTPVLNVMLIRHQHHAKQLHCIFNAFVGINQNHRSLGAVDDLMHGYTRPDGLGQQCIRLSTAPHGR